MIQSSNQKSQKTVIGIRTHIWSDAEENLYRNLLQYFSPDKIFVIADETSQVVSVPDGITKIGWNHHFLSDEHLFNYDHFGDGIGWLCGDYFYYAFQKSVSADFYWLVEPDVLFTFSNISEFFSKFENNLSDGLFARIHQLEKHYYWRKSAELIMDNPFGCSFPLSRLSSQAISLCKKERVKLSAYFAQHNAISDRQNPLGIHFPNDEGLVINTLKRENLVVAGFASFFPNSFQFWSNHEWVTMPKEHSIPFKNQLVHPARTPTKICDDLINRLKESTELKNILTHYHIVTDENIDEASMLVGQEIAKYAKELFLQNLAEITILEKISWILDDIISENTKPITRKIWRDTKSISLEFMLASKVPAIEFYLKNDTLTCVFFEKYVVTGWINLLADRLNKSCIDGKLPLFSLPLSEDVESAVRDAMKIFYESI